MSLHRLGAVSRLLVCCLLPFAPRVLHAQQPRPEVLRGRVVADSGGIPITGADVVVTMPPDRAEVATKTDSTGNFLLRVPRGTGDYLVHVNLLGWEPWRRRVTLGAADTVANIQVRLAAKAVAIAPLNVQAERPRPNRGPELTSGTGGKEEIVAGIHYSIARRTVRLAKRVGIEDRVYFDGGPALNKGLVAAIQDELGRELVIPEQPQTTTAFGAAVLARSQYLAEA